MDVKGANPALDLPTELGISGFGACPVLRSQPGRASGVPVFPSSLLRPCPGGFIEGDAGTSSQEEERREVVERPHGGSGHPQVSKDQRRLEGGTLAFRPGRDLP